MLTVVAVDRSGSTAPLRNEFNAVVADAHDAILNRNQVLAVWAVDREAVCLFGPRVPQDDRLPPRVYQELGVGASPSTERGTRPALFWEEMATRVSNHPGPARLLYLTDGGNDFPADLPRIQAAASTLGNQPRCFVTIAGIRPDQRSWIERAFHPLGSRLQIAARGEEHAALEVWLRQGEERN